MRLVTYEIEHKSGLGAISRNGSWVCPLAFLDTNCKTMQELIETISDLEKQLLEYTSGQGPYKIRSTAPIEEVNLLALIPHPRQDVICPGVNYMARVEESVRFEKGVFDGERLYATYFPKRANRATDPGAGIPGRRGIVTDLNYGAELAVIIGHEVSYVREEEVRNYVFGYIVINDVNARTLQTQHKQQYLGKRLDGFLPVGPCIATVDELPYPPKVQVQPRANGELRRNDNTEQLIFDVSHIVSKLSRGMTLQPGTVIITGTPAGVGMGFDLPRFLVPGNVVECIIGGIGTITSKVID